MGGVLRAHWDSNVLALRWKAMMGAFRG